jgi:4-amino-4-deoxy-L-arabinose transferase-like glycosyltransferase
MGKRVFFTEIMFLVVVTGIAAVLRWTAMGQRLWLDELTTAWVIRDSWTEIPQRSLLNNLSPLFYGLTWITTRLAGYDEVGIRLPSFLAGILVVPVLYYVAKSMTGSRPVAMAAALIAALDNSFFEFAVEARPYALVQLFALANIALLLAYLRYQTRTYAVLLGLNAALLFYLHYTTALFTAVNVLILIVVWIRGQARSRQMVRDLALGAAVFLIASLPLIPQLAHLTHHRHVLGDFIKPNTIESSVIRFNLVRYILFPLAFGAVVAYLVAARKGRREEKPVSDSPYLVMTLLWFLVPPIAAWMLARVGLVNINLGRYLAASSVACVLLSVLVIRSVFPGRVGVATLIFLILGVLWWGRENLSEAQHDRRQPWRELITAVNQSELGDIAVYVDPGLVERRMLPERGDALFKDYLLSPVNSVYRLNPDLLQHTQPIINPESLPGNAATDDFLFIGSPKELTALQSAVATRATRSRKTYQFRYVFEGLSTPIDVMAVHIAFGEKPSDG